MKIGLFGGTFDPVHNEHIEIAKAFISELKLDKLIVIPTKNAPHKKDISSATHRLNMLKLAFCGVDKVELSSYEIKNKDINYSFNTARHFAKIYPEDELFFLIGSDNLADIHNWREPKVLAETVQIVVVKRQGYEVDKESLEKFNQFFGYYPKVLLCVGGEISSTEVKVLIEFDILPDNLIPNCVYEYIQEKKLYKTHKKMLNKLRKMLKSKRYKHTAYTTVCAVGLAKRVGCDKKKAFIAAALHDCAKNTEIEKLIELGFDNTEGLPTKVIHAFAGRVVAKKIFKITDEDILNSITYHTTARPNMTNLEKLIFVADCIEKTRTFENVEYLRSCVYNNFEVGFIECLKFCYNEIEKKKNSQTICNFSKIALDFYLNM